nr:AAA family ATPase [Nakamurella aerolata]
MGDIVATLQAEQDAIVRAPREGGLVVQGGPGTGKTAVALHRAAYLLFAHPRIAERGVLIVGPSQRFLDYIGQVLPALGETQVVGLTLAGLLPGVVPTLTDSDAGAEIKGRAVWAAILRRAADELLPAAVPVQVSVAGENVSLSAGRVAQLLRQADAADGPATLRRLLVTDLTRLAVAQAQQQFDDVERGFEDILATVDRSLAKETGEQHTPLRAVDPAEIRQQVVADPALDATVERLRPAIDPRSALHRLLTESAFLARTAPELTAAERTAVARDAHETDWSTADTALLDELAAVLHWPGVPAESALRQGEPTLAERATADRGWAYGHVIVDEAQELSDLQWRAIARRCPTGSMTMVGDVNQVEAPGGHSDWSAALTPVLGERWSRTDLTVCYRTPQQVMSVAAEALSAAGATVAPPRSVRPGRVAPWQQRVPAANLARTAAEVLERWGADYAGGQLAVIAAESRLPALAPLQSAQVSVLTPQQSKGLEFDAVLLVDPDAIADGRRGANALYVAMTRCTQELGTLHVEPATDR